MIRQRATVSVLGGLLLCGMMVGCSDSASPTGPTGTPSGPSAPQVVDRTFTLAVGERAAVNVAGSSELQLTFRRVVSDDRCPADAGCLAGVVYKAVLEFDVSESTIAENATLTMGYKTQISTDSDVKIGDYTVRVEQLAPYRFASLPPVKAEDWRATIRITSAQS